MEVFSTNDVGTVSASGVNVLLYGRAGIGKTVALGDLPKPVIISAESGLLSLRGRDVAYVVVRSLDELRDVFGWLRSGTDYESVGLDSLSEVCDLAFVECRRRVGSEPAKLYPELRQRVLPMLSEFRALPYHFVATAHELVRQTKREDLVMPAVVGSKLTDDLPYIFDIVLHYTLDDNGQRIVYTAGDHGGIAKDRTGVLPSEYRDTKCLLPSVINKVLGV